MYASYECVPHVHCASLLVPLLVCIAPPDPPLNPDSFTCITPQEVLEVQAATDNTISAALCARVKQLLLPAYTKLYPKGALSGTELDKLAPRPSAQRDKDKEAKVGVCRVCVFGVCVCGGGEGLCVNRVG